MLGVIWECQCGVILNQLRRSIWGFPFNGLEGMQSMGLFTEEDIKFVSEEIDRVSDLWSKQNLLEDILRLTRGVILGWSASASLVADAAVSSLVQGNPMSLVRIGDGEGNILSVISDADPKEVNLKSFNSMFQIQDGQELELRDARSFAEAMELSLCRADFIGIRWLCPWDPSRFNSFDLPIARHWIGKNNGRVALGVIRAREHIERLLFSHRLDNAIMTQAWVHLALLDHLGRILEAAERVIVISGREVLRDAFVSRLESKRVDFFSIPIETRWAESGRPHHFPVQYEKTLALLTGDLHGALVLVGAGVFGKMYCLAARNSGAVALDLGSAFDVLAGVKTRPVHDPAFIEKMRWT